MAGILRACPTGGKRNWRGRSERSAVPQPCAALRAPGVGTSAGWQGMIPAARCRAVYSARPRSSAVTRRTPGGSCRRPRSSLLRVRARRVTGRATARNLFLDPAGRSRRAGSVFALSRPLPQSQPSLLWGAWRSLAGALSGGTGAARPGRSGCRRVRPGWCGWGAGHADPGDSSPGLAARRLGVRRICRVACACRGRPLRRRPVSRALVRSRSRCRAHCGRPGFAAAMGPAARSG